MAKGARPDPESSSREIPVAEDRIIAVEYADASDRVVTVKRIDRRSFILGGIASVVGFGAWWATRKHTDDLVVRILKRNLSYLILNDDDLREYAADLVSVTGSLRTQDMRLFSLLSPIYSAAPASMLDSDPRIQQIEDTVVTTFLISSDFFWNGEDETMPVNYLGLYEPGRVPCFNPLKPPG